MAGMNDKNTNTALASLVRKEREKRNWTQEHLAQVADVSTRTIQRLEIGGTHSPETLRAVATAFDIDCQDLLEEAMKVHQRKGDSPDPYVIVHLVRCRTGKALLDRAHGHALHSDYPAEMALGQAEEVGLLFDLFRDFGDIRHDLTISDCMQLEREATAKINLLDEMGLAVFCGAYRGKLAIAEKPVDWSIALVTVTENKDARIVQRADGDLLPALVPTKQPAIL